MHQAVQNGVRQRGLAQRVVPVPYGRLGGDEGRAPLVVVFENLEEVSSRFVRQDRRPSIVQNQEVGAGQSLEEVMLNVFSPHPELQSIQVELMAEQLEQAIGRARPYENPCQIHVFGRIPPKGYRG